MLSIDDYPQDQELMQAATEFAKEVACVLKQKYPDIPKAQHYRLLIGPKRGGMKVVVRHAILYKTKDILEGNENDRHTENLDEEYAKMVEEIFEIIKENYGGDLTKLHRLVAILEDDQAADSFIYDICHM